MMASNADLVSLSEVRSAHSLIQPHVHRTPLITSHAIDQIATDALNALSSRHKVRIRLAFKAENLQRIGAFKMRGATHAVLRHLQEARDKYGQDFDPSRLCVVTHSSGNHAAALACAAGAVGAQAGVVMPRTAPLVKQAAVRGYGARVVLCDPNQAAREKAAQELMSAMESEGSSTSGAPARLVRFVHPYDERLVIAGQGTLALEMLDQARVGAHGGDGQEHFGLPSWPSRPKDAPPLDIVVAPVGGGGMLSGVATAVKGVDERIVVIGAEPAGADDAQRSFQTSILQPAVQPTQTICDGLLTSLSAQTLAHISARVSSIATASDDATLRALRLIWERTKQVVEPSAAVTLAVIMESEEFKRVLEQVLRSKRAKRGGVAHTNGAQEEKEEKEDEDEEEIRIGVVWSGGNVELGKILTMLAEQAAKDG